MQRILKKKLNQRINLNLQIPAGQKRLLVSSDRYFFCNFIEVENYDCSNVVAIEESVPKGKDILIPPSIQKYMLFNHEAICICSEFVSLPKPKNQTVRAILSKYGNNEVQDPQSGLIEAFADSFDHFLPLRLLFSSELEQWKALTEKYPKKKASDIFGMEHFSRFLVKFPDFMKDSKTPDHIQRSLRNRINNLLEYGYY